MRSRLYCVNFFTQLKGRSTSFTIVSTDTSPSFPTSLPLFSSDPVVFLSPLILLCDRNIKRRFPCHSFWKTAAVRYPVCNRDVHPYVVFRQIHTNFNASPASQRYAHVAVARITTHSPYRSVLSRWNSRSTLSALRYEGHKECLPNKFECLYPAKHYFISRRRIAANRAPQKYNVLPILGAARIRFRFRRLRPFSLRSLFSAARTLARSFAFLRESDSRENFPRRGSISAPNNDEFKHGVVVLGHIEARLR